MLSKNQLVTWIELTAGRMLEHKDLLTELDSEIGDADHGVNMERGFKKVLIQLDAVKGKDIGTILRTTGMALISSVGGASGPLYGSFFLDAAKATIGMEELSGEELVGLFHSGISAVKRLGKGSPGDKTMLDTLEPALVALREAVSRQMPLPEALAAMAAAAQTGMRDTIPLIARKGRASYLGERSIGHQDPGATSACYMVEALYQAAKPQS